MSKDINLARKIKGLKLGQHFTVPDEKQRQRVCRTAKTLRDAGVIEFDIVTAAIKEGFKVIAI